MDTDVGAVTSLIFGRWRSQVLYAAAELRVFDHLDNEQRRSAHEVAAYAKVDPALLYRLLRALSAIGLVDESDSQTFRLTPRGMLLTSHAENSLLHMALLEEGPEHYALWKHLPNMVRSGRQNAFVMEYGLGAFEYAKENAGYAQVFRNAMSSFSGVQSALALEALSGVNLSDISSWCDVAGGQGHLLCSILSRYSHIRGTVFDLPSVVSDNEGLWPEKMKVQERCGFIGGDMFADVPVADAYSLKMILHDWNDEECVAILQNIRRRASGPQRLFIVEHIVPGAGDAHFSKLYDVHMMCWGTGRERTEQEYQQLLRAAGWAFVASHYPENRLMGVVEAVAA